jgi:hypothetical protein
VRCGAHQRQELERLCRYITRPAIANERLKRDGPGDTRLLKRVFDIDLEQCPQCGGDFRIIAAIEEPAVIVRIRRVRKPAGEGKIRQSPAQIDRFLCRRYSCA